MRKSKIQGELWGKSPNGWAEIIKHEHKPLWEAMLNVAEIGTESIVPDVGCGARGASDMAGERGAVVYRVDMAEGLLSIAIQRVPDVNFQIADIEKLPFEDNLFDVVKFSQVDVGLAMLLY